MRTIKISASLLIVTTTIITFLFLQGCETAGKMPPAYPSTKEASVYYMTGNLAIKQGRYETAINEFKQAIKLEPSPFLPHAWLATAYFSNLNFHQAALEFENTTKMVGGAEFGGPFPIMQALSFMRAGDHKKAEELLKLWSTPSVTVTAVGSYSSGAGTPQGIWKVAAAYLLGNVTESEYLQKAPQEDLSFPYLIIGINNIVTNNYSKARSNLNSQLAISGEGRWSNAIAKAELDWLSRGER